MALCQSSWSALGAGGVFWGQGWIMLHTSDPYSTVGPEPAKLRAAHRHVHVCVCKHWVTYRLHGNQWEFATDINGDRSSPKVPSWITAQVTNNRRVWFVVTSGS